MAEPCELTDFGRQCASPAVARYVGMCVHEHHWTGIVCERHIAVATDGGWFCNECDYAAEPHSCPASVIAERLQAVAGG